MSGHNFLNHWDDAQWRLPDPGDGEVFEIPHSGMVHVETGASGETRKLPPPANVGQIYGLMLTKDGGGDCVVTSYAEDMSTSQAVNQTGNNTITLADVKDWVMFIAFDIGGTLYWRVLAYDGAGFSTV